MSSGLRIESIARSHEGRVRTNNEDSYCDSPDQGLWAVADGMGGHERGEWASAAIVASLAMTAIPPDFDAACQAISEAIHAANAEIYREATEREIQMGSTVVALHVADRRFAIFWVGDSRAYLLRHGMLHQISRDHTQVQELVDRGLLAPENAEGHPMSHVLARAVGVEPAIAVDVIADQVESGDVFLLCSDGLSGQLSESEITEILQHPNHDDAVARLIELTLERGAPDNVTVVVVGVNETTLLSFNVAGADGL